MTGTFAVILFIYLTVMSFVGIYISFQIADVRRQNADLLALQLGEELEIFTDEIDTGSTEYEEAMQSAAQREAEFDERILRIKKELDSEFKGIKQGSVAEELHPDVKNLPHDEVENTNNPPEEYTI